MTAQPEGPSVTSANLEGRLQSAVEQIRRLEARLAAVDSLLARTSGRPMARIDHPLRPREAFDPGSVAALYVRRFSAEELKRKSAIWSSLAPFWAHRFPSGTRAVLELGAGEGEFLDHAVAERRAAVDLNPAIQRLAAHGIEPHVGDAMRLYEVFDDATFDVVFCSNMLEHLYERDQIHLLVREVHHVLRPGGRFLVLQPDVRFVGPAYFNFIDHRLALTAVAVVEALEAAGFHVRERHDRFLPFTTKSRLAKLSWLVPLYLRMPLLWRLFGAQAFLVAEKIERNECDHERADR